MLDFGITAAGSVGIYIYNSAFKAVYSWHVVVGEKTAIAVKGDMGAANYECWHNRTELVGLCVY